MSEEPHPSSVIPASDSAAATCVRSVVAGLLLENGVEEVEDGVCISALEHLLLKSLMKNAALSQCFAEHGMRAQAHFADAIMAVTFTGTDLSRLKSYAKEMRFPRSLDGTRLVPDQAAAPPAPVVFQSGDQRRLPRYIPDYFPPVPSLYTFEATPVQKQNKIDYKQAREKLALERRQVEKALIAYHVRVVGQFDSPFQLNDPCFSLLPATYGLHEPAYLGALVPSKFEDRRTDEAVRTVKNNDLDRSREDDEMQSTKEDGPPRKYRRHNTNKKPGEKGEKRGPKGPGRKPREKSARPKEDVEESNSASGVFSPGPSI